MTPSFLHDFGFGKSFTACPPVLAGKLAPMLGACLATAMIFLSSPANADMEGSDPATLDLDGVKLGMTPRETIAALKAYDPRSTITDNMTDPRYKLGATIWDSSFVVIAFSRDFADVAALSTKKDDQSKSCSDGSDSSMSALSKCDSDAQAYFNANLRTAWVNPHVIVTWFSPVAGGERVIAVSANTFFVQSVPTVANALLAIKQKYQMTPSIESQDPQWYKNVLSWKYDPRKRLMSKESTKGSAADLTASQGSLFTCPVQTNYCPEADLPASVAEGDGIQLTAEIHGNALMHGNVGSLGEEYSTNNTLLAGSMNIALFDSSAVYRYGAQAQNYVTQLQQQQDQSSAAQSQGNVPKL